MGIAAALAAKFSRVHDHKKMPCRGRRTAANVPLSKKQKEKAKTLPTLDGAKVDNLLTEVVQPIGFWQIGLVLLNALSSPNTVVLSIFINSFPNHRCKMSPEVETWIANATSTAVNVTTWSIRQIAELFSPPSDTTTVIRACEVYSIEKPANSTVEDYITLFANASARGLPTEKCPHGFVYDYSPHQYPGAVTTVIAAELTTAKYRSILNATGSIVQLTVQRMLIAVLAYFVDRWRVLTGCMFILNSGVLVLCFVLPESPKWLAARGRSEATGKSLYVGYRTNLRFANLFSKKANRRTCMSEREFMALIGPPCLLTISETEDEEEEIGNGVPAGDVKLETQTLKQHHSPCCRPLNRDLVWTTFLAIVLLTCHTISLYGMIFYSTHIRFHVSLVVAINALANLPGCFLSATLYRLFRFRKKPLLGLILTAATLQSVAALHTLILQPENDILLNVFGNLIILVQTAGIMMLFVYVPELYPPLQRNRGFGLSAGVSRLGALAFPFINRLDVDVRHGLPVAIYAGISTIQLLVLLLLKDTNGEVIPSGEVKECSELGAAQEDSSSSEASQSRNEIV
ncbi:unnamed protein product [Dibothriocephalus latus]|uniref:Major facilitator superfamily (MFS) profile domain-containing protein n=1 Tax=Dibothriocephalus latus TaxID=60516 RepID=A0A3P7LAA2_DIBLA|nr:unnamed protein product [Dibothriocephalus latus]